MNNLNLLPQCQVKGKSLYLFEILVKLYFLSSILLSVSNDGIDETRCIGTFSNDALEIAMSLAL